MSDIHISKILKVIDNSDNKIIPLDEKTTRIPWYLRSNISGYENVKFFEGYYIDFTVATQSAGCAFMHVQYIQFTGEPSEYLVNFILESSINESASYKLFRGSEQVASGTMTYVNGKNSAWISRIKLDKCQTLSLEISSKFKKSSDTKGYISFTKVIKL